MSRLAPPVGSPAAGELQIPASPGGPYAPQSGPVAVLQLAHGHFLITMSVTTTFPPSAVLPTVYGLLPSSQLQVDHLDVQSDEKTHKLRVQVVGVSPANNAHAVSSLAARMKALQPGASVTVHKDLSQLSVDSDSIPAISWLLQSSQSRALLDQHVHYYRLHSHPAFLPSLLLYITTSRVEQVLNIIRGFMADPVAAGATRPPRPAGMDVKGEEPPAAASASQSAPAAAAATGNAALPPLTPEKPPTGAPRLVQSSSRSPHFKPKTLPAAPGLDGAVSAAPADAAASAAAPAPAAATATATADKSPAASSPSVPTSVSQTAPIRIDNKWWSSRRAELLTLVTRHSLSHDSLYVYSLPQVRANCAALRSKLRSVDRIFFACKANHNADVLREIERSGLGFECVSLQELQYVKNLFPALPRERLLYTPNFASKLEYEQAYFLTDLVTLDNLYALEEWGDVFRNKSVLLRIDPGEGMGYHAKVQTGGSASKFGISVEQLKEVGLERVRALNIRVVGLHVHKGSGIHDAGVWARTGAFLTSLLPSMPDVRVLDLGGGLGVQYRDQDSLLDLEQMNDAIASWRASAAFPKDRELQVWIEPGRYVVANAGVLLAPVTQLKTKPGRSFVGLATGMNSLLRPALYESFHQIVNLSRLADPDATRTDEQGRVWLASTDAASNRLVDVVGPICETGDVLGHARSLPSSTSEGDIVLVDTTGAYGRVMSSNYNLREPAIETAITYDD